MGKNGKVYLIGAGPGDPELLTMKAIRALKESEAVLYDQLVTPEVLQYASENAELVFVGKKKGLHIVPQENINEMLVSLCGKYKVVSRLKGGDPFIFGRGGEELEYLTSQGLECEIIPGITAANGAAASIQMPLSHRDYCSEVLFITGHKQMDGDYSSFTELDLRKKTAVIYMGVSAMGEMTAEICKNPVNKDIPAVIIESATRPNQRIIRGTAGTIADIAREQKVEPPALTIIGYVVNYLDHLQELKEKYIRKLHEDRETLGAG